MNLNKTRIANLIGQITTQAAIITAITKHDVFAHLNAHIGNLCVQFNLDGWASGATENVAYLGCENPEMNIDCNLDDREVHYFNANNFDLMAIKELESALSRMQAFASGELEINKENITKAL